MWNHLPAASLIDIQRRQAITQLDQQIAQDWANGYGTDVDQALDRRLQLMRPYAKP